MSDEQQLRWEAENGPRFALAAFASVPLTVASFLAPAIVLGSADNDADALMRVQDHEVARYLGVVGLQAVAYVALAAALYYFARAIMARRPEGLRIFWPLIILGPVLITVASLLNQIDLGNIADEFLSSGARDDDRADELLDDRGGLIAPVGFAGSLCLAITFVLLAVNGMRAGLLSRFMGIVGILAAAVPALIPGAGAIFLLFWMGALGLLFTGRWPNGRGPAWSVVEPVPWPTAADTQAARLAAAERDEQGDEVPDAPEPDADAEPEGHEPRQRGSSRKKKRRRGH